MKKKVKFPISAYLLYFFLATFLLTGVSFSKYISSSSGGDEARVAKFGTLILTETTPTDNEAKIIPGVSIKKNPSIEFKDSEMAAYIFISVDAKDWIFNHQENRYHFNDHMTWSIDKAWTYLLTQETKQVFYLSVAANTTLTQNIITDNMIIVKDTLTASEIKRFQSESMPISFQAYAVQIHGFHSVNEAWNSVSTK